jgi:hypothetical protein
LCTIACFLLFFPCWLKKTALNEHSCLAPGAFYTAFPPFAITINHMYIVHQPVWVGPGDSPFTNGYWDSTQCENSHKPNKTKQTKMHAFLSQLWLLIFLNYDQALGKSALDTYSTIMFFYERLSCTK